jgi:DNA-binding NarL/FixJ family response regulator
MGEQIALESVGNTNHRRVQMHKVLVIEDQRDVAETYREFLKNMHFEVDCVATSGEALALLHKTNYAVLLSDLCLMDQGVEDSVAFLGNIRAKFPLLGIAVLSGAVDQSLNIELRQAGVNAVMRKPQPLADVGQILLGISYKSADQHASVPDGLEIARRIVRGASHEEIGLAFGTSPEVTKHALRDWFNSLSARERIAVTIQLSREAEGNNSKSLCA